MLEKTHFRLLADDHLFKIHIKKARQLSQPSCNGGMGGPRMRTCRAGYDAGGVAAESWELLPVEHRGPPRDDDGVTAGHRKLPRGGPTSLSLEGAVDDLLDLCKSTGTTALVQQPWGREGKEGRLRHGGRV